MRNAMCGVARVSVSVPSEVGHQRKGEIMGKTYGEMTPAERGAMVQRATAAFQRELDQVAPQIGAVLSSEELLDAVVKEARGWLADCGWRGANTMGETEALENVAYNMEGGFAAFIAADQSWDAAKVYAAMAARYGHTFAGHVFPQRRESGYFNCACCGDTAIGDGSKTVCDDCQEAGCEPTRDSVGDFGYWNCAREDFIWS